MKRRFKTGVNRNSGLSLNILTDNECHEIHLATLELLKDTGVYCESEEALAYFDGGGCQIDLGKKVVKFPNWVVEDAIRVSPGSITCCGRSVEDDVILEDNRVTFTNFGEAIRFVDPYTGEELAAMRAPEDGIVIPSGQEWPTIGATSVGILGNIDRVEDRRTADLYVSFD